MATCYDVVLVDAAGKDSKEMRTALASATVVLAPMQPSQADLDTTEAFVNTVTEAKDFNPGLRVLGVLNRASTRVTNSYVQQAREYLNSYPELPLANVVLHERKSYQRCLEDGRGVVEMKDPKAKAEIQILTQEVMAW